MSDIQVFASPTDLAQGAAELFVQTAREAIAARGRFCVALSGGSTPRALHTRLAAEPLRSQVDWSAVHVFWGDERCVPPDHPDSNYRMAKETLLDAVPIPASQVYRMRGELPAVEAAVEYEGVLRGLDLTPRPPSLRGKGESSPPPLTREGFDLTPRPPSLAGKGESVPPPFVGEGPGEGSAGERAGGWRDATWPRLDLIFLGMGDDGHTASLFPGTIALAETSRWVVANYVDKLHTWRVTLSAPAINAGANVVFLVAGANKADRLYDVLRGPAQPIVLPSQSIRPTNGRLLWLVDEAAATRVKPT